MCIQPSQESHERADMSYELDCILFLKYEGKKKALWLQLCTTLPIDNRQEIIILLRSLLWYCLSAEQTIPHMAIIHTHLLCRTKLSGHYKKGNLLC